MKKEKDEFFFKVKTSDNKFNADIWETTNEVDIRFKHFNNKATVCEIHDNEAYKVYMFFLNVIYSEKQFPVEIINSCILFREKAVCLAEDVYNRKTGEDIALEKALNKRRGFYMDVMDFVHKRLTDMRHETNYTIKNKWKNIWDKMPVKDQQLGLPFEDKK